MPTTPQLAVTIFILCIYIKNVEPVLSLVPRVKAFALPRMSKRATLKAPRRCVYNSSSLPTSILLEAKEGCI